MAVDRHCFLSIVSVRNSLLPPPLSSPYRTSRANPGGGFIAHKHIPASAVTRIGSGKQDRNMDCWGTQHVNPSQSDAWIIFTIMWLFQNLQQMLWTSQLWIPSAIDNRCCSHISLSSHVLCTKHKNSFCTSPHFHLPHRKNITHTDWFW